MNETKGPACSNCGLKFITNDGKLIADVVDRDDLKMTFVCCRSCGAILSYRDNLLMDKLDEIIKSSSDIH